MDPVFTTLIILGIGVLLGFFFFFKRNYRTNNKNNYELIRDDSIKKELEIEIEDTPAIEQYNIMTSLAGMVLAIITLIGVGIVILTVIGGLANTTSIVVNESVYSIVKDTTTSAFGYSPLLVVGFVMFLILLAISGRNRGGLM